MPNKKPQFDRATSTPMSNVLGVQSAIEQMRMAIIALEFHPERLLKMELSVSPLADADKRTRTFKIVLREPFE